MGQRSPILLNTVTQRTLMPNRRSRQVPRYSAKQLANYTTIKNEDNMVGLVEKSLSTDQFLIRYTDGTQETKHISYVLSNMVGQPTHLNYANDIAHRLTS